MNHNRGLGNSAMDPPLSPKGIRMGADEVPVDPRFRTAAIDEVLAHFGVTEAGLSSTEAARRQTLHGSNELPRERGTPFWKMVLEQFRDHMVQILLVSAVISFVLAFFEKGAQERVTAFIEPLVIALILLANAIIGVYQESNAEKAIEALKKLEPKLASVRRDGRLVTVPAAELVPGDVVEITVGDRVPADLRLLQIVTPCLRVDQAILTGEGSVSKSIVPCPSAPILQDMHCTAFSGTTITVGTAVGVVVGTGRNTAIGDIHREFEEQEQKQSPLQDRLDEFGTFLSKVIMVICAIVWVMNIPHFAHSSHGGWVRGAVYYFKIAVALAVAAIPEGLPAVVTTCLALGTKRMAAKNAIVRHLPSVETLGCTTVICTDKTGTLTTNQMSVRHIVTVADCRVENPAPDVTEYGVDGTSYEPKEGCIKIVHPNPLAPGIPVDNAAAQPALIDIAEICALCNDAHLEYDAGSRVYKLTGDGTEGALLTLCEKIGLPNAHAPVGADTCRQHWLHRFTRVHTLFFTPERRRMSVFVRDNETGAGLLMSKGAPEVILSRCTSVRLDARRGTVMPLTDAHRRALLERLRVHQAHALRCLAFAVAEGRPIPSREDLTDVESFDAHEQSLTFVGAVAMLDPPRPEVRHALKMCRSAGIRVIVITGDNKETAESICRSIGLFGPDEPLEGKSIQGSEFKAMTSAEQVDCVKRGACLFSRVEPSHKSRLVEILQEDNVVAMSGDGVNDAPALSAAHIGIAMGSGTEVAKEASKMILADDNFATIVAAVEEGRAIYSNTKQFIRYLISSNIGEVISIFLNAAIGAPEALTPVQLLWVNLVTDGLPATALGFNKPDKDVMTQPPRGKDEPIVNRWTFFRYMCIGIYIGCATVFSAVWWWCLYSGGPHLSLSALVHFRSCTESPSMHCAIFAEDTHASTMALSVLVLIEMLNALNNLSENQSLLVVRPSSNVWAVLAIGTSLVLHAGILYIPFLRTAFGVAALNVDEWLAVFLVSVPVLLIDEVLKAIGRGHARHGAQRRQARVDTVVPEALLTPSPPPSGHRA